MTLGRCVTCMSVKQLTLDVLGEVGVGRSSYNDDIVLLVWLGNTDGLGRCLSWWRCLLWSPLGRLRGWWLLGRWGWWKIRHDQKSLLYGLTSLQVKITYVCFLHCVSVPYFKSSGQRVKLGPGLFFYGIQLTWQHVSEQLRHRCERERPPFKGFS